MVAHLLRSVLAATFLLACACSSLPHGGSHYDSNYQPGHQRSADESSGPRGHRGHSGWPDSNRGQYRPWPPRPHIQPYAPTTVVDRNGFDNNRVSTDIATQTNTVKGTCVDGGREYKEGDRWTPPDRCARHSCAKDGNVAVLGCPPVAVSDNCLPADEDLRQPWPLCCAVPACTKSAKQ